MTTGNIAIFVGIGLLLAIIFVLIFNSMVESRNRVKEAWSGMDVQLKRRHDLVPNLVKTVRAYAGHERAVLERTIQARADAMRALGSSPHAEAEAEISLSQALGRVSAVAEDYPELRAAENFQKLQRELSHIEDEIQASRRIYNTNAQAYNTKVQSFPNSIVARTTGFKAREYFEIDPAERAPGP
jgi:LemA protein